ncbi:MAG: RNA methyltransferase [Paludibacteraceae bacterium]|nr:RNA methyltransferase [Paludibacteraceae bacterium]
MLSKAKIKLINQLSQKKYRQQTGLFIAEGHKTVEDMMGYFTTEYLYYTSDYSGNKNANESCEVTYDELKKISRLETPQNVLAVFKMPVYEGVAINPEELTLALDGIQDAGNMGTIIRIADWFGINNIFASKNTVDIYNPKVVQATMGALSRVRVHYVDLVQELNRVDAPIYVTALDGDNINKCSLTKNGVIVMGNEGNGVSQEVMSLANKKLLIPSYPPERPTSESLNVSVATAIVVSMFRSQI